jgi:hypothetical protein
VLELQAWDKKPPLPLCVHHKSHRSLGGYEGETAVVENVVLVKKDHTAQAFHLQMLEELLTPSTVLLISDPD